MAHIAFPDHAKSFKTPSSSATYSYVYIPASSSAFTILFLHGFPSSSYDWRHQISHFSSRGYGILVPDLLGYGETDKPHAPTEYTMQKMATEVVEILDREKLTKVHGVAHDFGGHLISRVLDYFPDRLYSCAFLAVPYLPPGGHFDLDVMKDITENALGFEKLGYMRFMSSEDSGGLLDSKRESFSSLIYTSNHADAMQFYPAGALAEWLTADRRSTPSSYVTPAEFETHERIFAAGGYRGPTNWYRGLVGNINEEAEKKALEEGSISPEITCPVLAIDSQPGKTGLPGFMEASMKPFAKDMRARSVSTDGHWLQLQSRDEVNSMLEEFFKEVEGQ